MTLHELEYVLKAPVVAGKIGSKETTDGGTTHPLWAIVDIAFPPTRPWRELPPAVRQQVVNAAKLLHANCIPYGFYVDYLQRAHKGYLKRKPMTLFASGIRKNGTQQILREYVEVFKVALDMYRVSPDVIRVNDVVYNRFPQAWDYGLLKYVHSLTVIRDALKTQTLQPVLLESKQAKTIDDFWNGVGETVYIPTTQPMAIDLTTGASNRGDMLRLRYEMGIRMGRTVGTPNPELNKYFKKNGTLSATGITIVSGEAELG